MKTALALLLLVFGVLGFGANLLYRAVFLYEDWKDGNPINWGLQFWFTFGIPLAYLLSCAEILAVIGFFSQPAVFDFSSAP